MNRFIIIFLFISFNTYASKLNHFSKDLEQRLMIDLNHLSRVEERIKIRWPNAFERWLMNKSGAEATYNDKTNVIVLRKKNFIGKRLISRNDLPTNQRYSFIVLASTIFHELAHADYDTVIENSSQLIKNTMNNMIRWFKRNTRTSAKIAAHEFFGYTAGDILNGLEFEIQDILLQHKIHPQTLKCFSRGNGFTQFSLNSQKNYVTSFTPRYIFIKGKSLDLEKVKFPKRFNSEVYNYFSSRYNFPKSRSELISIMNKSKYFDILMSCNK